MRSAEPEVRPADRAHPDVVGRPRPERSERRRERGLAEGLQTGRRAEHASLGDVELNEPLRGHGRDVVRVGGVADLPVEDDQVGPVAGEPGERLAEGFPRRDRRVVDGRRSRSCVPQDLRRPVLRRRRRRNAEVVPAAELIDRRLELIARHRLAVPAFPVGEEGDPVPFLRPSDDEGRAVVGDRVAVRAIDLLDIVPVDRRSVPTEGLGSVAEHVRVPSMHRRTTLPEAVEVEDRGDVACPVERDRLHRFPHRAFRHLGVTQQDPDPSVAPVEPHREGHPEPDREALAERAGRHVHPGQLGDRRRMALQRRSLSAERQKLVVAERADPLQGRVEPRRRVALRQDEPVVQRVRGILDVEAEMVGEQDGQQVRAGHRRGRVTGTGGRRRAQAIDGDLCGEPVPELSAIVHRSLLPRRRPSVSVGVRRRPSASR